MFAHWVMGMPAPFSPGPLSDISPGTCPVASYFPPVPVRRPSAQRLSSLSSLGGLEMALEAMERREGNEIEIEKDDVDSSVVGLEREAEMILGMAEEEEVEVEAEADRRGDGMGRRRGVRGREGRRLAMVEGRGGCGSAQDIVGKAETQQEEAALAFKERVQAVAETSEAHETLNGHATRSLDTLSKTEHAGFPPSEFIKPRRHSAFHSPGMHDILEEPSPSRRASMTSSPQCSTSSANGSSMRPDASWFKAYNNVIGKAHFVERRNSIGKGGVLHARVQKKICGRRRI